MEPATAEPLSAVGTFLFCDVERSTELWEQDERWMSAAIREEERLVSDIVRSNFGVVIKFMGDGCCARFDSVRSATHAALEIQRRITLGGGPLSPLSVRVGLHTGEAEWRDGDYYGRTLNMAARIMDTAYGGQIVASNVVAALLGSASVPGLRLQDMGEFRLRGFSQPERLYLLVHPDVSNDHVRLRVSGQLMDNIPSTSGALIGRDADVAEVAALSGAQRLVTLHGPGGVGKTRLAIAVAERTIRTYRHGACFCDLAPVTHGDSCLPAIATALGVQLEPGRATMASITDFLGPRELLLVFDNCEHIIDPVAALATRILAECRGVHILATSRESLGLSGEYTYIVTPLEVSSDGDEGGHWSPAELLLLERAVAANSQFTVSPATRPLLGEICRRLDGLPLAIELAAARFRTLAPFDILERLDDRFDFLCSSGRTGVGRQETLRATVAWSYDLLSPVEQRLFTRLSVFVGGFSLDAALALGAVEGGSRQHTGDVVSSLVVKSMLGLRRDDHRTRYRMNETLREFGAVELDAQAQREVVQGEFIGYFCTTAARARLGSGTREEATWAHWLEDEIDNLRLVRSLLGARGDRTRLCTFLADLFDLALWRMHYEVGDWCADALRLAGVEDEDRYGEVAATAAYRCWARGEIAEAMHIERDARALEAARGRPPTLRLHDIAASLAVYRGEWDQARQLASEWCRLAEARGDLVGLTRATFTTAIVAAACGDQDGAHVHARSTLRLGESLDCPTAVAWGLHAMGQALRFQDAAKAAQYFADSAATARSVRNHLQAGVALREVADLKVAAGDRAGALTSYRDVIRHWRHEDDWANEWLTLLKLSPLLLECGREEEAAMAVFAVARTALGAMANRRIDRLIDRYRERVDGPVLDRAAERTAEMSHGQLISLMALTVEQLCDGPSAL